MKYHPHIVRQQSQWSIVLLGLLLVAVCGLTVLLLQPGSRHYTCTGLGAYGYDEILSIFNGGHAAYLDRNHDGIPCNEQKKALAAP